jgi:hypothetical protein
MASVVDSKLFVTDPDPTFLKIADPDPSLKSSGSDFGSGPKYLHSYRTIIFTGILKHTFQRIPVPVPVFKFSFL